MERFLAGMRAMDDHYRTAPLAANLPALLGLWNCWNATFLGRPTTAILPYQQARANGGLGGLPTRATCLACSLACSARAAGLQRLSAQMVGHVHRAPISPAAPPSACALPCPARPQALQHFAPHIQQLSMESNGKGVALDGTRLPYETGAGLVLLLLSLLAEEYMRRVVIGTWSCHVF